MFSKRNFLGLNHLCMLTNSSRTGRTCAQKQSVDKLILQSKQRLHPTQPGVRGLSARDTVEGFTDDSDKGDLRKTVKQDGNSIFSKGALAQGWRWLEGRPVWRLMQLHKPFWKSELIIVNKWERIEIDKTQMDEMGIGAVGESQVGGDWMWCPGCRWVGDPARVRVYRRKEGMRHYWECTVGSPSGSGIWRT